MWVLHSLSVWHYMMSAVHWFWVALFCCSASVNVIHTNTPKYLEPLILVIDQNDEEKNNDGPGRGTDAECWGTSGVLAHFLFSLFLPPATGFHWCCSLIMSRGAEERSIHPPKRSEAMAQDNTLFCAGHWLAPDPGSTSELICSSNPVSRWQLAGPLLGSLGCWLACSVVVLLPSSVLAILVIFCRIHF